MKFSLDGVRGVAIEPTYFDLEREEVDAARVVARLAEVGANAIRLGAASHNGCAYFPSKVFPRAPGLGRRDMVAAFQRACRTHGIDLVLYTNATYTVGGAADEHPEWVSQPGGTLSVRGGHPLTVMCNNGPYFDRYLKLLDEIVRRYEPAAMYIDCFGLQPRCGCRHCVERFFGDHRAQVPREADWASETWRTYAGWLRETNRVHAREIVRTIRRARRRLPVIFNYGVFWSPLAGGPEQAQRFAREIASGVHAESAVRFYNQPFDHIDEQALFADALGAPLWVWVEYPHMPWSHVACPPAEQRVKAAKVFACGARPMLWSYPCAPEPDRRGLAGVADVYRLARDHAELFDGSAERPAAGLLFSSQTAEHLGRDAEPARTGVAGAFADEFHGLFAALRRAHLTPAFLLDDQLGGERADACPVLVLPNAACLSDAQCEAIRRFVRRGGGLLATHESSLYDERGTRREDFGLADVFGCSYRGVLEPSVASDSYFVCPFASYMRVQTRHPAVAPWPKGHLVPTGGKALDVRTRRPARPPAVVHEPLLYYCSPPGKTTRRPGLVANTCGKGRCVYVPWPLGTVYRQGRAADVLTLVREAVRWCCGGDLPIETDLPPTVSVQVRQARGGALVVHLVNLSIDAHYAVEEVVPVEGRRLTLRLAGLRRPAAVRALVGGSELAFAWRRGELGIELPRIAEHEVVVVEQAKRVRR